MKCRMCKNFGMKVTNNGKYYYCTFCGWQEPYKPEPIQEVAFTDIKEFVENLK